MNRNLLIIALFMMVGGLAGCISGKRTPDTYTDQTGKTTVIESDSEQCTRACNDDSSRCMDTTDARTNGGVNGPKGMFGASADCRNDLSSCLSGCKAR